MRVSLRSDEVRVAQQFLHAPQIRPRIQQVRGVAVPQLVRRERGIESGGGKVFF